MEYKQPYSGQPQANQNPANPQQAGDAYSQQGSRGPGGFTQHNAAPSEAATANRYYGDGTGTQQQTQPVYRGPEPVYASSSPQNQPQGQHSGQYPGQHQNQQPVYQQQAQQQNQYNGQHRSSGEFYPPPPVANNPGYENSGYGHPGGPSNGGASGGKRAFWQVPTLVCGGALLALTAIGVGYMMGQGEPVLRADIPVIYAPVVDERVRPVDPGGMEIPDRDKTIMNSVVSQLDLQNDADDILAMPSAFDVFENPSEQPATEVQATPAAFTPGAGTSRNIEDLLNLSLPSKGTDAESIESLLEELEVNDAWTEGRLLQRRLGINLRNALKENKVIDTERALSNNRTFEQPAQELTLEEEIEQTLAAAAIERDARLARQQILLEREKHQASLEARDIKTGDSLVSASAAGRKLEAQRIENQAAFAENPTATTRIEVTSNVAAVVPAIENPLPTFEELETTEVALNIPGFGRNSNVEPLIIPASAQMFAYNPKPEAVQRPRVIQEASFKPVGVMNDVSTPEPTTVTPVVASLASTAPVTAGAPATSVFTASATPNPPSIFDLPPPPTNNFVPFVAQVPFVEAPMALVVEAPKAQIAPVIETAQVAIKPAPTSMTTGNADENSTVVDTSISSGLSFVTAKNVEPAAFPLLQDSGLGFNSGNIAFYQPPISQQFAPETTILQPFNFNPETNRPTQPRIPVPLQPVDISQIENPFFPETLQVPIDLAVLNQNGASRPFIYDPSAPVPLDPFQIPVPSNPKPVLPVELSPADIAKSRESLSPLTIGAPTQVPALTASASTNFVPFDNQMLSDPLIDKLNKGGGVEVAQLSLDGNNIAPVFDGAELPPLVEEVEAEIMRMNQDINAAQQQQSVFGQQPPPQQGGQQDLFQQQQQAAQQQQFQQQQFAAQQQQQQAFQQDLAAARIQAASNAAPAESPFEGANIPHRPVVPVGLTSRSVGTPFAIQLASVTSSAKATKTWATLQKKHPELLGDMVLGIQTAKVKGKSYYRVQAGPIPNRETGADLCAALKAARQDCIVAKRK